MPGASSWGRPQVDTAQFPVEMAVLTAGLGCSSGGEPFGVVYAIPAASQAQREPWQYVSASGGGGDGGFGSQDPIFLCLFVVGLSVDVCVCVRACVCARVCVCWGGRGI